MRTRHGRVKPPGLGDAGRELVELRLQGVEPLLVLRLDPKPIAARQANVQPRPRLAIQFFLRLRTLALGKHTVALRHLGTGQNRTVTINVKAVKVVTQ